jgi:hypothetical protein
MREGRSTLDTRALYWALGLSVYAFFSHERNILTT